MIGGYLAFIGFFCLEASLAMMAGVDIGGLADWSKFWNPSCLVLLIPGLLVGVIMYLTVRCFKSPYVLPCSMAAIIVGFYTVLWMCGASIQDARDYRWVAPLVPQGTVTRSRYKRLFIHSFIRSFVYSFIHLCIICVAAPFYEMWDLFDFRRVEWWLIPTQGFRWFGMMLVVAFSSSLDVAAIEMELGLALDYNRWVGTRY